MNRQTDKRKKKTVRRTSQIFRSHHVCNRFAVGARLSTQPSRGVALRRFHHPSSLISPCSTAVPNSGRTTLIPSASSPERDVSTNDKRGEDICILLDSGCGRPSPETTCCGRRVVPCAAVRKVMAVEHPKILEREARAVPLFAFPHFVCVYRPSGFWSSSPPGWTLPQPGVYSTLPRQEREVRVQAQAEAESVRLVLASTAGHMNMYVSYPAN